MMGGDAIDDARIPVVQHRAQVIEKDHRHAGYGAELAIREGRAGDVDGLARGACVGGPGDVKGLVRSVRVCRLSHGHSR